MKTELKVGIFVLLGLGILGYFSTRVSDGVGKAEDGVIIKTRFDSVAGLVEGAEVRAAGVRVGHVKSIKLERGKAMVEIQLGKGVEQEIPRNSRATISSLGLLGEKYVEIIPPVEANQSVGGSLDTSSGGGAGGGQGGGAPQELQTFEQGDTIQSAPPQGLDQISGKASEIADDVKVVAAEIRRAVGEGEDNRVKAILQSLEQFSNTLETVMVQNQKGIDRIVSNLDKSSEVIREVLSANQKNIDATLEHVRGTSESLDKLLSRNQENLNELVVNLRDLSASLKDLAEENRASLHQTVQNVESVTGSFNERMPQILTKLDSVATRVDDLVATNTTTVHDSLSNVRSASSELDQSMGSLKNIFSKIDEGEGTLGKLVNQDEVHDNLNKTMSSLRETLGGFQKFKTYLRMRAEGKLSDGGGHGYFGVDLVPSANKFYRIEISASDKGVEFRNKRKSKIQIGDGPETLVETDENLFLDTVAITGLLGFRHKNLSIYGGMIEYRGGFGAELRFLKDRGYLNFEISDFGNPVAPRSKITGNFFITPSILLTAGLDDPFNKDERSPILGLGLRFQDDDIKNLLGLVATAGP